jgi:L-alanine-DL-glutamate epimerase-like enolase superfamily enzyme
MRIAKVNLLHVRHGPKPKRKRSTIRKQGTRAVRTAEPLRTTIIELVGEANGQRFRGLGEIRSSGARFGESAKTAWLFSGELGSRLLERELDENESGAALLESLSFVAEATRDVLGIGDAPLGRDSHRPTRFAFEAALVDLVARASGRQITSLFGVAARPVVQNVRNFRAKRPEELLTQLVSAHGRPRWTRIRGSSSVFSDISLINVAASGAVGRGADSGIWIDGAGEWGATRLAQFLHQFRQMGQLADRQISIIIEQPIADGAYEELDYFVRRIAQVRSETGIDVRAMLDESLWGVSSIRGLERLLPEVDLNISVQRAGGIAEVFRILALARELGFRGKVYFGNPGANTDLSTAILAALSAVTPEADYFSASAAKAGKWPLVLPRLTVDPSTSEIQLPRGSGLAAVLNSATLYQRLEAGRILTAGRPIESGSEAVQQILADPRPVPIMAEETVTTPGGHGESDDDFDEEPDAGGAGGDFDDDDEGTDSGEDLEEEELRNRA